MNGKLRLCHLLVLRSDLETQRPWGLLDENRCAQLLVSKQCGRLIGNAKQVSHGLTTCCLTRAGMSSLRVKSVGCEPVMVITPSLARQYAYGAPILT